MKVCRCELRQQVHHHVALVHRHRYVVVAVGCGVGCGRLRLHLVEEREIYERGPLGQRRSEGDDIHDLLVDANDLEGISWVAAQMKAAGKRPGAKTSNLLQQSAQTKLTTRQTIPSGTARETHI